MADLIFKPVSAEMREETAKGHSVGHSVSPFYTGLKLTITGWDYVEQEREGKSSLLHAVFKTSINEHIFVSTQKKLFLTDARKLDDVFHGGSCSILIAKYIREHRNEDDKTILDAICKQLEGRTIVVKMVPYYKNADYPSRMTDLYFEEDYKK